MAVQWTSCDIPGVLLSDPFRSADARGTFTKIHSGPLGDQHPFAVDEIFWSQSREGVIRGLHVQAPPRSGRKLVFVTSGEVRDFIVDLRVGSPYFGQLWESRLSGESGALLIPPGCAHGFEALSPYVTMVYLQEGAHDPSADIGVLWKSAGIIPRTDSPIVSQRDKALPDLKSFASPFSWIAV